MEEKVDNREDILLETRDDSTIVIDGVTWNYRVNDDDTVTITGLDSAASGNITIPSEIDSKSVTSIGNGAFWYCTGLTSLTIPASVTSIGNGICSGCSSLVSFSVAAENSAYKAVSGLLLTKDGTTLIAGVKGDVVIPSSVTSIGGRAFYSYYHLTSVTIPNSVISIGTEAFRYCSGLTSVTIPNSVTSIGDCAFSSCSRLESVTIPNSVISIGDNAFSWCGLRNVTIPNSVTSIGNGVFAICGALMSVTIPDSVTSIGNGAFEGCSRLTSLAIPASVTSIGNGVFQNCSSLGSFSVAAGNPTYKSVSGLLLTKDGTILIAGVNGDVVIPNSVISIGDNAFRGSGLTSVTIPDSVTSIGEWAFYKCTSLTSITIPGSVTSMGSRAFSNCSGLTSVTIGSGVTSIGDSVFEDCIGLTSVTIPDSVTSIGGGAFHSCSGLTSVTIGNGVTNIGSYAFYGCTGLTSLTIGDSVTSIERHIFDGCTNLTAVHIHDLAAWCGIAFSSSDCNPLVYAHHLYLNGEEIVDLVIPDSVTNVANYAFYACHGLTSVTIPDSVTSIGSSAFDQCSGLASVTIGNNVVDIGWHVFQDCNNLKTVIINKCAANNFENKTEIFNNCTSIESFSIDNENTRYKSIDGLFLTKDGKKLLYGINSDVVIPDGVTNITNNAFYGYSNLSSITIPSSVTNIGSNAFTNCTNLSTVSIPGRVTDCGSSLFSGCSNLAEVTINNGVTGIGEHAFQSCNNLTTLSVPASWEGTSILDNADVPEGCEITYIEVLLSISGTSQTVDYNEALNQEFTVTANMPWTVESDVNWLNIKTPDGYYNGTVIYDILVNSRLEQRTGTITVSGCGLNSSFTITQTAAPFVIELSKNGEVFSSSEAASDSFDIESNTSWTVTVPESYKEWVALGRNENDWRKLFENAGLNSNVEFSLINIGEI